MAVAVKALLASLLLDAALASLLGPDQTVPAMDPQWIVDLVGAPLPGLRAAAVSRDFDPLLDLDPVELSRYWGYDAELHHVTTDDGYILGIHRVRNTTAASEAPGAKQPVVVMGHPLLSSSAEYLVLGPGKALAYMLADEGFDVWLQNVRGNTYSLNHTTLSTKEAAFWDFSYDEHGTQDLPALIQYAMQETGQQEVQYVGFSMGTTSMFIMGAERPDVAKHVKLYTGFAPVAEDSNARSAAWRGVLESIPVLKLAAAPLGVYWILPSTPELRATGETLCADGALLTQPACVAIENAFSGRDDKQNNATLYPYILSRFPAGTSFKNLDHFRQGLAPGFHKYDYGTIQNLAHYGQLTAPSYNLSNVFIPTRLYYGPNDLVVDAQDVLSTCAQLSNVLSCEAVDDPEWTHMNFVWAKQAPELVYRKAIARMKEAVSSA
ncbi:gastric triacylglycerol lipase-like [Frankliniella occidentalis]|uniref:Lipase n=1 Tax=Frankliniella occidentalis TaxID=133901 RepID=A0A6J1SAV9_FRAOC|nr:gastric triacylglycerol lipase-like [Frankliniella occidentalis]XP_026278319.1 gastric triacylglycerol lipase-like [Frankliniella occidentalis]